MKIFQMDYKELLSKKYINKNNKSLIVVLGNLDKIGHEKKLIHYVRKFQYHLILNVDNVEQKTKYTDLNNVVYFFNIHQADEIKSHIDEAIIAKNNLCIIGTYNDPRVISILNFVKKKYGFEISGKFDTTINGNRLMNNIFDKKYKSID